MEHVKFFSADVLQVSAAYIAISSTIDIYRRNFTALLIFMDDPIGRGQWKTDAALPYF